MNKTVNPEILRYKNNSLSFWMSMLAIIFQCIAFVFTYKCLGWTPEFSTGLDIIINIIFLLFVFLASEKLKTYNVRWGYIIIGIGLVNLIRIFTYLIPTHYVLDSATNNMILNIDNFSFILSIVSYVLVAVFCTIGGIVTIKRGKILNEFLATLEKEGK